ncbi:hypothetical protein ACS0TY_009591 [Phlomoides rotata]
MKHKMKHVPKRIILVRHGESEGNKDETVLEHVPNHKLKLSKQGRHQAQMTGSKIRETVSIDENWKVLFYVSPTSRTRETLKEMMNAYPKEKVVGVREECRLREQHYGILQDEERRMEIKRCRVRYGKFFYRVPDGDSGADVYDRVSAFLEGGLLWKDMESNNFNTGPSDELNLIIITHGLTMNLFLMKWFNWTVDQFEALKSPGNCECRVLQIGPDGEYSLALHHQVEELKKWGLSDEMIREQIFRAHGPEVLPDQKSFDDNIEEYGNGE